MGCIKLITKLINVILLLIKHSKVKGLCGSFQSKRTENKCLFHIEHVYACKMY